MLFDSPGGCSFTVKDASKIQDELRVRVRGGRFNKVNVKQGAAAGVVDSVG